MGEKYYWEKMAENNSQNDPNWGVWGTDLEHGGGAAASWAASSFVECLEFLKKIKEKIEEINNNPLYLCYSLES